MAVAGEVANQLMEVSMRSVSPALMVIAVLALPSSVANAIPITFTANLSGANEVPPVVSPGTGEATVILDAAAQTLQINVTFSGLTSKPAALDASATLLVLNSHSSWCRTVPGGCSTWIFSAPRDRHREPFRIICVALVQVGL